MDGVWVKKVRVLTFSLIFSGALNIGLLAALVAVNGGSSDVPATSLGRKEKQEAKLSNSAVLEALAKLSFRELVALLTNRDWVEEGYTKRDLAVAALVAHHHFNLEKALSTDSLPARVVELSEGRQIELFPGLTDEQFDAVIRFAYQEKYPLTTKGLFSLIKRFPAPREESLEQAFFVTPEFYALQVLFQKTNAPQEPSLLLKLVSEGSWNLLAQFAKEQAELLDLSNEKRQKLLLSYLAEKSKTAFELLLKTDLTFALKQLDDKAILEALVLAEKSTDAEKFCVSLLQSPRSDAVWKLAVEKLYGFEGEALPEPFDLRSAAARFAKTKPVAAPVIAAKPSPAKSVRTHVVQEGESLWKISRQYKAKVEEIVKLNEIEKDRLYPGMTLKIPD